MFRRLLITAGMGATAAALLLGPLAAPSGAAQRSVTIPTSCTVIPLGSGLELTLCL